MNEWSHTSTPLNYIKRRSLLFISESKVKVTLVQALRLCTGRTAHRGSRGIALLQGKGKVHPCTGTEALYRPYGP